MPASRFLEWICLICATLSVWPAAAVRGQDETSSTVASVDVPAGHSYHGEVFNEGPRQKAYLMGTTGDVHFPVTTTSEEARAFFNQGVGQLHGFWFFEAERSFRQVAALDAECAMAYWGMAMANFDNDERALGLIEEARERREGLTDREGQWIQGLWAYLNGEPNDRKARRQKYLESLERIVQTYPEDIEAKAFLVVRLWQFRGDLPIVSPVAVNALLAQVLAVNPRHPIHHYRIHLWDRVKPEEALASAAACGQASPGIAHMWHMPGHIFSRLERYGDAAWQQEASARVDHAHMIRDGVLPDQIHNYAHNNEWLIRNLNHIGRVEDALALAKNMLEVPRHPTYNMLDKRGTSAGYGRARLLETLERYELWDELLALSETMYLEATEEPATQDARLTVLGRAHFGRRDAASLDRVLSEFRARIESTGVERVEAEAEALAAAEGEGRTEEEIEAAKRKAGQDFERRLRDLGAARKELLALRLYLRDETEAAVALLDAITVPFEREARWALLGGAPQRASEILEDGLESAVGQVVPLAYHAYALEVQGQLEEAATAFESLRTVASSADLETPPLKRLDGLAKRLGYQRDWRAAPPVATDLGDRPALDSLGPLRWGPRPAPAWKLTDGAGKKIALESFRGRPLVLIFYLGAGCLHCVEQLETFAPAMEEYEEAGLAVLAVSTEDSAQLKESLVAFREDGKEPPFPLLSNAPLDVFRAYRVYDDFEEQALHGTFLIDGEGRIRWQDISYEPFNDADFLLEEAKRLLGGSNRRRRL